MVQLYFGNNPVDYTVIKNMQLENNIGAPYPVPADNSITFPFTMALSTKVTVSLTDVLGRLVRKQTVDANGGQKMDITFQLNELNEGIYIYSVCVDGQLTNGRISITH